jgi:hypothetical protein
VVAAAGAVVAAAGAGAVVVLPQAATVTETSIVATKSAIRLYSFVVTASPPLENCENY